MKTRMMSLTAACSLFATVGCGEPTAPANTGIEVLITTAGIDVPSFTLSVNGVDFVTHAGERRIVSGLTPGDHTITLQSAGNCTSDSPATQVATVARGALTPVTFAVTCVATTGVIEITIGTSGEDVDFGGYLIRLDDGQQRRTNAIDVVSIAGVSGGTRAFSVEDVPFHCAIAEGHEHTVDVRVGGTTRDTARVALHVTCAYMEQVAFTRKWPGSVTMVVSTDGQHIRPLIEGRVGSWSPDGKRLAVAPECDQLDWWYYGCPRIGIHAVNLGDRRSAQLTSGINDDMPSWSPDGSRIAFIRDMRLWMMNADGSAPNIMLTSALLAAGISQAADPSWSPDGQRIAFTCVRTLGQTDICAVNSDGTGLLALTNDSWADARPSWSPDGTQIALTSRRDAQTDHVAIMNADGSGLRLIAPGRAPSWSPDGRWLVFAGLEGAKGIWMMSPNGTDLARLTIGDDTNPVWRPGPTGSLSTPATAEGER